MHLRQLVFYILRRKIPIPRYATLSLYNSKNYRNGSGMLEEKMVLVAVGYIGRRQSIVNL